MTNDTLGQAQRPHLRMPHPGGPSGMPRGFGRPSPSPSAEVPITSVTSGDGTMTKGPDAIATQPLSAPKSTGHMAATTRQRPVTEELAPEFDEKPEATPASQTAYEPESRQLEQRRRRSQGKWVFRFKLVLGLVLVGIIASCQGLPIDGVKALDHALSTHPLPQHVSAFGLTVVLIGVQWILLEKRIYDMLRIFTKINDVYLPYANFVTTLAVACYSSAVVAWMVPILFTR